MKKGKKETTVMAICKYFGCRCNICGGFIPDGDFMCGNGHEEGKQYPIPAPKIIK